MHDLTQYRPDTASEDAAGSSPIRIMLVASVRLYREGLATELGARPNLALVGLAADVESTVAALRAARPDVVLLDVMTARTPEIVRAVRAEHPDAQVVAFAVNESEQDIAACADAGVTSFVTRDVTVDGLAAAISAAVRGELTCSARTAAILFRRVAALSTVEREVRAERSLLSALTAREREIASLLAVGRSNKAIAHALTIEVATVKNHVHNILEKLHLETRAEVAAQVRVTAQRAD